MHTHLNPNLNDLSAWRSHLKLAIKRESFAFRPYDHRRGRFSQSRRASSCDLLISQGLFACYDTLSADLDLKIYLEMEEELRTRFKTKRDSVVRNQKIEDIQSSIVRRKIDFQSYIAPQKEICDLSIYLYLSKNSSNEKVQMSVRISNLDLIPKIRQVLNSIQDIHFDEPTSGTFNFQDEIDIWAGWNIGISRFFTDYLQLFPNELRLGSSNLDLAVFLVLLSCDEIRTQNA